MLPESTSNPKDITQLCKLHKYFGNTFKRGKLIGTTLVQLVRNTVIKDLEQEEVYKSLGVDESNGIQHAVMKEKIRKECYWRVQAILKT